MRKTPLVVAAIAAALLVGTLLGPGVSAASSPKHQRITVVAQDSEATFAPADFGQAPEPNQRATEDAPVYRDGHAVGIAETALTLTRVAGDDVAGLIECSVELPEGNILFAGSFHFADLGSGATVPVVGGTAGYAGYTGTVTMVASADASQTTLSFDLIKP